ncbi:MAG: zinc metallopeptidase [Clostridia bacterium]|nr:zinc metallopeptidase [Clostridia bacterium]
MVYYLTYTLLGIILLPGIFLAIWAQFKVTSTYNKTRTYMPTSTDKTADVIAREILDKNGLHNIELTHVDGELTDHYHPKKGYIALSDASYGQHSIAAISIAAHEVGHAIQRKEGHFATRLREFLVPFMRISDVLLWPLVVIGLIFNIGASFNSLIGNIFMWSGVAFFGLAALFSLVTLPTELDASKRALQQLEKGGYLLTKEELSDAKSMLTAAALTYIASLLVAILNFARFLLTILILRNEDR